MKYFIAVPHITGASEIPVGLKLGSLRWGVLGMTPEKKRQLRQITAGGDVAPSEIAHGGHKYRARGPG
jgi:hypothetical protein